MQSSFLPRNAVFLVLVGVGLGIGLFAIQSKPSASAAAQANRLNNLGVGYMNQQAFKKALGYFQQARAADPSLLAAKVNEGIALLNLQQTEPARQTLLEVVKANASDARAWYNLGLLYRGDNQPKQALDAFQHAAELEPKDADSHYFLGTVHMQMQQFPQAIEEFQKTLQLDAYHASAEFGLARAYQQSGNMAEARVRLAKFQQITKSKLGAAMSVAYGDQGPLSLAESSSATVEEVPAAIPVRFVDVTTQAGLANFTGAQTRAGGPGACLLDFDNDGRVDILVAGGGKDGRTGPSRKVGAGGFADVTQAGGLDSKTLAIRCSAGDYDNDGFTDLAVGFNGRVALYHNEKGVKFADVTQAAGIHTDGLPMGMTFIDYDHDGDLDLYIARSQAGNVLWRNNGNSTFTDVTALTGLAGSGSSVAAVGTDFNNDRAIDFVVTGSQTNIYANPREGKFAALRPWQGTIPDAPAG